MQAHREAGGSRRRLRDDPGMADADAVARMARALRERAATAGANFDELAKAALTEAARTITIVQGPLPPNVYLVLVAAGRSDALKVLAQVATLAEAQTAATAYLNHEGAGEVYGAEIKRVLTVA